MHLLLISHCLSLEKIICLNKLGDALEVAEQLLEPFAKQETLVLEESPILKNIFPKPLPL